jgi:acetoin utilization protein AcuB
MNGSIAEFMTRSPHTIGLQATLVEARKRMNQNGIRHLPVLEAGTLVGLLSQRDIQLIESLQDVNPAEVTVEEAMSQDVLTALPTEKLAAVCDRMAKRKAGSAVIVAKGKVYGIFTTIDALKALASTRGEARTQPRPSRALKRKRTPLAARGRGTKS